MTFINEGTWDRVIRFLVAIAFGSVAWITWPGAVAVVFGVIAAIALLTSVVGFCPIYTLFGFSTTKKIHA